MTEKANPSPNRPASAFKTAGAIAYGGSVNGFIIDGASPTKLAVQDADIDDTVMDAFAETSSGSSLTVDIAPGEAFVFGSWLAIDTQTTVTLDASTNNQTVYIGWNKDTSDDVIIGLDGDFASAASDEDQRITLYDFDTDGSGVTNVTDRRDIGQTTSSDTLTVASELGIPVYADSSNAPQTEGNIIAIDGSGSQTKGLYSHDGSSYSKTGKTDEGIEDIVAALIVGGADTTASYDDSEDTLTINNDSPYSDEKVEDAVDALLTAGDNVTLTYDDGNDELTVAVPDAYTNDADTLTVPVKSSDPSSPESGEVWIRDDL